MLGNLHILGPCHGRCQALFKDEQHYEVSKLRGACELEAFRAACAGGDLERISPVTGNWACNPISGIAHLENSFVNDARIWV